MINHRPAPTNADGWKLGGGEDPKESVKSVESVDKSRGSDNCERVTTDDRTIEGRSAWRLEQRDRIAYFRLPVDPVTCIFTTRTEGASKGPFESLNLAYGSGDEPERVQRNLERLKGALDIQYLVTLRQTHSDVVLYINYDRTPPDVLDGDALFTDQPGLALGVRVADCLPIYLFSTESPIVGLAHAGWRGTRNRVIERMAGVIQRKLGVPPANLSYAFGPCIGPECYEIGSEVAREFRDFPEPEEFLTPMPPARDLESADHDFWRPGVGSRLPEAKFLMDIKAANRQLLSRLGITEVANLNKCTRCSPGLFFSARRDKVAGRNMAVIFRR
jgi:polyphenol oxidase